MSVSEAAGPAGSEWLRRRVEDASLNAWPALQQIMHGGWILRFSGGYTKRANSVNPLYASDAALEPKLRFAETCYSLRGLPTIFRLTPFATPAGLDAYLGQRGYTLLDPTQVMVLDVTRLGSAAVLAAQEAGDAVHQVGLDRWATCFAELQNEPAPTQKLHRAILRAIPGETRPYVLRDTHTVVGCALGVVEEDQLGLFDVLIAPAFRRQGYGNALVSYVLAQAQHDGLRWAYLQVTEANVAAQGLYRQIGFTELYRYWYRIRRA